MCSFSVCLRHGLPERLQRGEEVWFVVPVDNFTSNVQILRYSVACRAGILQQAVSKLSFGDYFLALFSFLLTVLAVFSFNCIHIHS